ncbi:flavodoxin domain-containing protein [Halotalea alkalilenta]|uniref:flavodoxin domain-containing protein n=1 Tax=Halotalea alkalilenta TaxID=376489 RepID=UPI0004827E11|nr:flavodoxin domain-containing protein [Halotalea alkalilenta]
MPTARIFVATVFGGALDVAEEIAPLLREAGFEVTIFDQPVLEALTDPLPDLALFCISTTGSGDFPGNFVPFVQALDERGAALQGLRYGLIAMGDSSYPTFCGAGRRLDGLLAEYGAQRLGERLEIDAMEVLHPDEEAIAWAERWIEQL